MDEEEVVRELGWAQEHLERLTLRMAELNRRLSPFARAVEELKIRIDDFGSVFCGEDGCGCRDEASIILTPFEDLTYPEYPRFTARQLLAAIEDHIEQKNARLQEEDEQDV